jgi:hypothetical protein
MIPIKKDLSIYAEKTSRQEKIKARHSKPIRFNTQREMSLKNNKHQCGINQANKPRQMRRP